MIGSSLNSVFYARKYHPIQAGSIDGTDILPHDNGVYRAYLCSSAGLYDPFGDPKVIGDPYCTVFVGRLSHSTTEHTLRKAMSKYGKVKNLRLVRDIVTGASRGYAFVEFETDREMRRAYRDAHHSFIDDSEIIVDYNRQQLMPGWIPRRLGGGLGGRKESGQLRFGGRERPFRAPLQSVPVDELKRLGISPPPEGRYMTRFQVPSPPRRPHRSIDREESSPVRLSMDRDENSNRSSSAEREERYYIKRSWGTEEHSEEDQVRRYKRSSVDRSGRSHRKSIERKDYHSSRSSMDRVKYDRKRSPGDRERSPYKRSPHVESYSHKSSREREENSEKRHKQGRDSEKQHKHGNRSDRRKRRRSSTRDDIAD